MWDKVLCLWKQHDNADNNLSLKPPTLLSSDQKSPGGREVIPHSGLHGGLRPKGVTFLSSQYTKGLGKFTF